MPPGRPTTRSPGSTSGRSPQPLDLSKEPLEPEADLLLFIRDHNRDLADWQRTC